MKIASRVVVFMLIGVACGWASEEEQACGSDQLTLSVEQPASEQTVYDKHWYMGVGGTNYHPRLRESEGQIKRELNDLFDWMPWWKKPTTFADWRDNFMVWDFVAGFGRDLTLKTNWMLWFGGATGSMTSREHYGPIFSKINFKRSSLFLAPELFYYPMGKVDYDSVEGARGFQRVRAAIANTKPYLSLVVGGTFVKAEADVKFKAPLLGTLFRQEQSEDHYMYTVSPRAGLTMPIGKNTSLNPVFIYLFNGPNHSTEYNGWAFSFTVRWRF